jgi:ribosome maturation factor RimP
MVTNPAESIRHLVEPLVTAAGFELWDVDCIPGAIRVFVERPGGVDLESLGPITHAISDALDARDELAPGARYQLEVSSPGVERTLRTPAQYQRFIGTLVAVKTAQALDGARRFQGTLLAADESGIRLGSDQASGQAGGAEHDFSYGQILKARTVLAWGPSPKPGSSARTAQTTTTRQKVHATSARRSGAGDTAGSGDPAASKDVAS